MIALKIGLVSIIGALIGWTTNIIAIKLIFRPLNPIKIPGTNIKMQGLIPKRRSETASSIGQIIETELLSFDDILQKLANGDTIDSIKREIIKKLKKIVEEKIPSIIFVPMKSTIFSYIETTINEEGEKIIFDIVRKAIKEAPHKINLSKIVEDKINSFELEYLEKIIISISKKELKYIELIGALLGFIIGLAQGLISICF